MCILACDCDLKKSERFDKGFIFRDKNNPKNYRNLPDEANIIAEPISVYERTNELNEFSVFSSQHCSKCVSFVGIVDVNAFGKLAIRLQYKYC